jgi:hypothetical protein
LVASRKTDLSAILLARDDCRRHFWAACTEGDKNGIARAAPRCAAGRWPAVRHAAGDAGMAPAWRRPELCADRAVDPLQTISDRRVSGAAERDACISSKYNRITSPDHPHPSLGRPLEKPDPRAWPGHLTGRLCNRRGGCHSIYSAIQATNNHEGVPFEHSRSRSRSHFRVGLPAGPAEAIMASHGRPVSA